MVNNQPSLKKILSPVLILRQSFLKKRLSQKEIFQNFSELLCEDPIINVSEFGGRFAVDARSDIFRRILINKSYEPELVQHCLNFLDKTRDVIDVGANVGFFTVMFAKNITNKKVLSIEPTKNAIRRLRQNLELNDVIDRVDVFEGVASNQNGTVEIKTIEGKEEYSSLGEMLHPSISKESYVTESIISTTIDALVEQKSLDPGFLKVDVEGVEHLVFEGAQETIKNKRPIILSELSNSLLMENGSSSEEVINLIKKYDYDVFDPVDLIGEPGNKDFGDILCFPKEMKISFM